MLSSGELELFNIAPELFPDDPELHVELETIPDPKGVDGVDDEAGLFIFEAAIEAIEAAAAAAI